MSTEQEKKCLSEFLNDTGDASEKLESLVCTVENIEHEYKLRCKHRLNDLQLILNNSYASKGVLRYTKDYKRQLMIATKEINKQINEMDEKISSLSSDIIVNEKRYNDFRNNVVGQAQECEWEMDKLLKLLNDNNYDSYLNNADDDDYNNNNDNDAEPSISERYDKSKDLQIAHANCGSIGLELNKIKANIQYRNSKLQDMAKDFKQIRFGHAMQYHHNKEAYIFYRKTADLTDIEKFPRKQRRDSDDFGLLLDTDEQ